MSQGGTGVIGKRSSYLSGGLEADYTAWYDTYYGGSKLRGLQGMNRARDGIIGAGGSVVYAWDAQSRQGFGNAAGQLFTSLGFNYGVWGPTVWGGPYAGFATAALYMADATWQETTTYGFFVWHWCYTTTLAVGQTICGKWDTNGNHRSWRLWLNEPGGNFELSVDPLGTGVGTGTIQSTYATLAPDTWYFIAGWFLPSTEMRIYVGAYGDDMLTVDSLAAAVPAQAFDGTAPLTIGSSWNNAGALTQLNPWVGMIGTGMQRAYTQGGQAPLYLGINAHATRLFQDSNGLYR